MQEAMFGNIQNGVIGIDVGGTKIAGGLFSPQGAMLHHRRISVAQKSGEEVVEVLVSMIKALHETADEKLIKILGTGIAVPGRVDPKSGMVWAPNIAGWIDLDLQNVLSQRIDASKGAVHIDSDRSCYILGEQWKGNARGATDAIFVAVGTGIGAGILSNGQIINGHGGTAGAIGWLALDRPFISAYKQYGCYEYHASGTGLALHYQESINAEKSAHDETRPARSLTAHDLFSAYQNGDAIAGKIIDDAIEFWGMATANLISLFNPQIIIFGGGVFGPAVSFIDKIQLEAEKWSQPLGFKEVKMTRSALGDNAGLYGAAKLALMN
jgi:glucokinase